VVVDMTPRVLNDEEWQLGLSEEMCEARRNAFREDFANFAIGAGQAMFAQPVREEHRALADWAGEEFARNDPAAIDALWSSLVEQDFRPVLRRIRQPDPRHPRRAQPAYGSDTQASRVLRSRTHARSSSTAPAMLRSWSSPIFSTPPSGTSRPACRVSGKPKQPLTGETPWLATDIHRPQHRHRLCRALRRTRPLCAGGSPRNRASGRTAGSCGQ
jgi:hypothetical protein